MKKLFCTALFLTMSSAVAFSADFTGYISDAKCNTKHAGLADADKACIDKCVKGGEEAVFIVGDKVYKVDNQDLVKGFLGQKVTISGKLKGDTVHAAKVETD